MIKKLFLAYLSVSVLMSISACNRFDIENDPITYGDGYMEVQLNTDKACYAPGEAVNFTLNKLIQGASNVMVRYRHLGTTLEEAPLSSCSWSWQPPATDYQGYMVDLYSKDADGVETVYGSIAVDVSSTPDRFPRNGFLSAYGNMTDQDISDVMSDLNRHHINYVQFQDWHYKHHKPLAGTPSAPMEVWTDIINRDCYKKTVEGYIEKSHQYGMKSLFYNLAYGALADAAEDGVQEEWYLFKDASHVRKDCHELGSPFKSSIYIVNSGNEAWIDYITKQNSDVYAVFDFDGYQIDQLGDRGETYDYYGNRVYLDQTFKHFIESMKEANPDKSLVMNAVGQYGQENQISKAPVDFLYTEVWDHSDDRGYTIFSDIITNNDKWSNGKKTVLAAYMNYEHGRKGRSYFNTPGILMGSAAAFAWGGSILQLGEHLLCNEYFPNNNLSMRGELKIALIHYYDFLTAYQNLLRDGGEWYGIDVTSTSGDVVFNQWGPVRGQIATVGKRFDDRDVIHLLSYRNATHLDWCDTNANQGEPDLLEAVNVSFAVKQNPKAVWVASPDVKDGVAIPLEYEYAGGKITTTLPALKYWDMIVVEY